MLNQTEREKLDDEHALRLKKLYRAEESLDYYYGDFEKRSYDLMDFLYESLRDLPTATANHFIYQMEENLSDYRKMYERKMDDVLEERYRENKQYYDKLDEMER